MTDDDRVLAQAGCEALAGYSIPAKRIGLPTNGADIESAVWNADEGYCAVTGWIRAVTAPQDMQFRVNLPNAWNGRTLQFGGGGFDGSLVTATGPYAAQPAGTPTPLASGWVTLGSDGGHQGAAGFDGTFQLDDELFRNYGQESVKKAHDAAYAVIKRAYGTKPEWSYFIGASQGGHEALDAVARYPKDYDGVIANYPAYNVTMMHVGAVNFRDALQLDDGAGHLNSAETATITDAVYATCDSLDGAADGVVSNVAACSDAFDVTELACPEAVDPATADDCLSDVEIAAAEKMTTDYDLGIEVEGNSIFARSALFEGALYQGFAGFGTGPRAGGLQFDVFTATMRYGVTGDAPGFDPYTVDPLDYADRVQEVGEIMDVTDVSLNKFRARGGKVILTHGTMDDFITPHNTVQYYEKQQDEFGKRLPSFLRFYMVPGWGHGSGNFAAQYDGLDAIVAWVERGDAPDGLVAHDGNTGAERTRPMCEYPAWPQYTGEGSLDEAASYRCITEQPQPEPDSTRPQVTLVSPTTSGPFASLSVRIDATDDRGLSRVVANVYRDGTLIKSTQTTVDGGTSATHTAQVSLPEGSYTVKYNAHDLAGNVSHTGAFPFTIDTTAPTATVKDGAPFTIGADGTYKKVSFKLADSGKVDRVVINGTVKDLTDNAWSDVNFIAPGVFGAVAGSNEMVVYDAAGNATSVVFTLTS